MKKCLSFYLTLFVFLIVSIPTFAYTVVDTSQIPGFTSIPTEGQSAEISSITYYDFEENLFLVQGGSPSALNATYVSGQDAINFLISKGFISKSPLVKNLQTSNVTQYYDWGSINVYPMLKGQISSPNGSNWVYDKIDLGAKIYNFDTFKSARITFGGIGFSTCKATFTFETPSSTGSKPGTYTVNASFKASDR